MVDTGLNYCVTPMCRGTVNRKLEHNKLCTKCRWRRWKEKSPAKYAYGNLKRRAKQRGKIFTLTFQQYYKEVWLDTGYAERHGKTKDCLSVDRKRNEIGYVSGNLKVLTVSENSIKGQRKQFVKFFAHQMENQAYKPSERELAEASSRL